MDFHPVRLLVILLFTSWSAAFAWGRLKWEFGGQERQHQEAREDMEGAGQDDTAHRCSYVFGRSLREEHRTAGQSDPLFIWLGPPSSTLPVHGPHGRVPALSLWRSYVNVIYLLNCSITTCHEDSKECAPTDLQSAILDFVLSATHAGWRVRDKALLLGGIGTDAVHGGAFLPNIAKILHGQGIKVDGVMLGNYPMRPEYLYVPHRSMQSGNGMHEYSVNRAREDIVCNAAQDEIKFVMNDISLSYVQSEYKSAIIGPAREEIRASLRAGVAPDGTCVCNVGTGDDLLKLVPNKPNTLIYSYLPTTEFLSKEREFPFSCGKCDAREAEVDNFGDAINGILENNISVLLYDFIHLESQALCSFYIGIFECAAIRMRPPRASSYPTAGDTLQRFNAAELTELEDISFNEDGTFGERYILGRIQDSGTAPHQNESSHLTPSFTWIQLDSRLDGRRPAADHSSGRRKSGPLRMLSKASAFEILSHLTKSSGLEVEWAELFIHD